MSTPPDALRRPAPVTGPGASLPPRLPPELHAVLRAQTSQWFGACAQLAAASPKRRQYRQSFQWRCPVRLPDGSRRWLLVKIPRLAGDAGAAAQIEFAALRLAAECAPLQDETAFRPVRALAHLPSHNALVTEWLAARPLPARLNGRLGLGWPAARQRLERVVGRAARWLGLFHTHLGEPDQQAPWALDMRSEVERELGLLRQVPDLHPRLPRLGQRFEAVTAQLEHLPAATVWLHGDLSAANVLVDDQDRVAVIDIARRRRGVAYFDLALLLVTLTTRWPQVLGQGVWLRWADVQALWRAALPAYAAEMGGDSRVAYLYAALATLHLWRENERTLARLPGLLGLAAQAARPVQRRYLSGVIDRYLALAEGASHDG